MRSCLHLFALIIVAGAAPPEPLDYESNWLEDIETTTSTESITNTTEPTEIIRDATSPIGIFRRGFASYEKRIRLFIENMRRSYMTTYSDNVGFVGELNKYEDLLPTRTKNVTQKYRPRCYCENGWHTPCPDRCIHSCHYYDPHYGRRSIDDCDGKIDSSSDCYCYDGSTERCNYGQIENCYKYKTVELPVDQTCVEFAPNRTAIETSYMRFSELLIEPLKKLVRTLDFQLGYLKQAVIATDLLNDLTAQMCADQSETPCLPEVTTVLANKVTLYKQLQRNLTLDMIKTQDQAEKVSKNINNLKEQMFTQINLAIKKYTCCLKGLTFAVVDNECDTEPRESTNINSNILTTNPQDQPQTQLIPTLDNLKALQCMARGDHLCNNKRCIPESYRCDGTDDCGDGSDEANC